MKKTNLTKKGIIIKAVSATVALFALSAVLLTGFNSSAKEKAKDLALEHAGVTEAQVETVKSKFDFEDGKGVYEVKFIKDGVKYEYIIDASSREILKTEQDGRVTFVSASLTDGTELIGEDAAKAIALEQAGVFADAATFKRTELDRDDGRIVYEVEFYADGWEYDYEIDAVSGAIIKSDKEYDGKKNSNKENTVVIPPVSPDPVVTDTSAVSQTTVPPVQSTPTENKTEETKPVNSEYIGFDKAKELAAAHAGFDADSVWFEDVELDREGKKTVYEIDFQSGAYEYEYEIDALSGEIIKSEKELDD